MEKIRKMNDKQLEAFVTEKREALRALRFGTGGGRDVKAAHNTKKEIARALTEYNARRAGSRG